MTHEEPLQLAAMHSDLAQQRQSHSHSHAHGHTSVAATPCPSPASSPSACSFLAERLAERERSMLRNAAYYYKPDNIVKVLVPVSILGWLAFGAICILCINGHGRAGRWIPEWYLDSEGTRWDKAAVGAWWLAVMFGWPVILPCTAVGSLSRRFKGWRAERQRRRTERDAGYIA